ncbi:MAG: hypothetical protein V1881_00845 [Candidatus Micrarchaeota archaeon]
MGARKLLAHCFDAYGRNFRLISFFSVPLLIAFPLALLLPNYLAASGIFLRFGSIQYDLSLTGALFIVGVFLVALLLFSFAIAAINIVIKHQRTFTRITHNELEGIEEATFSLFIIFLTAFILTLVANLLVREYFPGKEMLGSAAALVISLSVLFAPQAVVIDGLKPWHAIAMSASIISRRFYYFVFFLCFASVLLLANTWIFLELRNLWIMAPYVSLVINAMILLPFFEVMKTQIYMSKYTLLR